MASLMGSIGFVPRVFLCFLSSLGSFPLTSFFFHANRISRSRIGLATSPAPRFLHPSSATFQTFRRTIFVILSFLSAFLSFCLSIFLVFYPSGFPVRPGFWVEGSKYIYHIVHLLSDPVKLIPAFWFLLQSRQTLLLGGMYASGQFRGFLEPPEVLWTELAMDQAMLRASQIDLKGRIVWPEVVSNLKLAD